MAAASINDSGRMVGHAVWLERRAFEIVGAWARDTEDPAARLVFASQSRHHGWRAGTLEPCLPATRDHDSGALIVPLDDGWGARVDELAAAGGAARVVAARTLLELALEHAEDALASLGAVADGAARRVVRIVVDDARNDVAALRRLDGVA